MPADVLDVPGLRVRRGCRAAPRCAPDAARLVVGRRFGRPLRFVWDGRQRRGVLTVLSQHVQIALVPCGSGRRPGRCG
ncbi:MAG: hypothetical protein V9F04_14880 [Dermatophilaceae bacterium]